MKKTLLYGLLLLMPLLLSAQQGIFMSFDKKNTQESPSKISRNSIKIKNATTNTYPFLLEMEIATKWQILGKKSRTFILAPGDSIYVPVYVKSVGEVQGGEFAVLNASLFSDGFLVNNDNWILSFERFSNWHLQPLSNQIYFLHNSDTAKITYFAFNQGNADETLEFDLNAFRDQLSLYQCNFKPFKKERFNLAKGADTTLNYYAVINKTFQGESTYSTLSRKPDKVVYNLRSSANNVGDDHFYTVDKENVSLNKVYDYYQENRYSTLSLPMIVQLDAYNILEESTYLSFQAYGNKTFNNLDELNYFYQTNFNSNILNAEAFLGDYFFIGYHSQNYFAELGNLVLNHEGASVSGKGVRGEYSFGNHDVGGGVVANPNIWDIERWGAGTYYKYDNPGLGLKSSLYTFYEENNYNFQRNITALPGASWRINKNHLIRISTGFNIRTYLFDQPGAFTKNGLGTRLSYSGRFNRLSLSASGRYSTATYEPMPGMTQITGIAGYFHKAGLQSRFMVSHFTSQPEVYDLSGNIVQSGLRSRTNQAEYKISSSMRKSSYSGSVYVRERFYNFLQMYNEGIGFSYYNRFADNSRISFTLNTDVNQLPEIPGIGSFFTARLKTSYRIRDNILINLRYHYGPYYYYEFSDYALNQQNPQTFFVNGYYETWLANNRLQLRVSGNYNYRLNKEQHIFNSRPELFWYTLNGLRMGIYGNLSYYRRQQQLLNQTESFFISSATNYELGFGVRKELGLPISGKRFFDVDFIAFYDANGNGIKDKSEVGLTNVLVVLENNAEEENYLKNDYSVLTSDEGKARLENIRPAEYRLTVEKLTKGDGFYTNNIQTVVLNADDVIYLPFSSGGKILGTLQVQKASYSRFSEKDIELANIRITVTGSSGKTYYTLTDSKGFFKIEVPGGSYTVSVNSAVFGGSFNVNNNSVPVTLGDENSSVFVNFLITEKERKLNIKRFNNDGTVQ